MNRRAMTFELVFGMLTGACAGLTLAACLLAVHVFLLDGAGGAVVHYGGASFLAVLFGMQRRWRRAARPLRATVILMLLLTFVLRRFWTMWVNLEPLDWRSGPAGHAVGVVFSLQGFILGAVLGADTALKESSAHNEGLSASP